MIDNFFKGNQFKDGVGLQRIQTLYLTRKHRKLRNHFEPESTRGVDSFSAMICGA